MEKNNSIKDLSPVDRPREKLKLDGIAALSNAELIAVLLGSGTRTMPVMNICKELTSAVNNDMAVLSQLGVEQLRKIKGIGEPKAMMLLAAFELGRRSLGQGIPLLLKSDEAVTTFITPYFKDQVSMQYQLVLMNHRQELLATCALTTDEGRLPLIKSIIKLCLEAGAHSLVICRNEWPLSSSYLSKEHAFIIQLDAAASMLRIGMRGLLVIDL